VRLGDGKACPIKALGNPARPFFTVRAAVSEPNRPTPRSPRGGAPIRGSADLALVGQLARYTLL